MVRLSLRTCICVASLLLAGQAAAAAEEEGDDGADELPATSAQRAPDTAQLLQRYRVFGDDATRLTFRRPPMPDLSRYTSAAAKSKVDRSTPGTVSVAPLLGEPGFNAIVTAVGQGLRELAFRQRGGLRAIIVEGGYVDLASFTMTLPKEYFEQTAKGVYVARLPILVRHGATLYLGADTRQLRLSQERGALLSNEGELFVVSSGVIGWSEGAQKPAAFKDKHEFRPFIVSWGGSHTYIVSSRIANLGYASTKAFGLSFSQYSTLAVEHGVWPRPTGWIIKSDIEDLWYGFYAWESDDIVLRGNTFRNNIKYGIDPHDRSRRLIIAENEVYGTLQKHGIIISREVNDSWIVGNRTHDNKLSGIVLDRQCSNNVIANNVSFRNGSDGIVISESSRNILWSNLSVGNQHHGIRLRNSTAVRIQDSSSIGNGLSGIYGVARNLAGTDRNLKEDPYTQAMSMTVVGGQLSANGSGPINVDDPTRIDLLGIDLRTPQRELGFRLGGALLPFQIEVLDILLKRKQVSVLVARETERDDLSRHRRSSTALTEVHDNESNAYSHPVAITAGPAGRR